MNTEKTINEAEGNAVLPLVSCWLSFPENKPQQYSLVLVTVKSPIDTWVELAGYADGKFQLPARGESYFVTHWMPIPAPACS